MSSVRGFVGQFSLLRTNGYSRLPRGQYYIERYSFRAIISTRRYTVTGFRSIVGSLPRLVRVSAKEGYGIGGISHGGSLVRASMRLMISILIFP